MFTAHPIENGLFCNHFSHATQFNILNDQGHVVQTLDLPEQAEACSAKHSWPSLLKQANVERIVVRHIGERMLSRCLEAGLVIDQLASKPGPGFTLAQLPTKRMKADDGHRSPNFEKKQASGCCQGNKNHVGHECGQHHHENTGQHAHQHKKCCQH